MVKIASSSVLFASAMVSSAMAHGTYESYANLAARDIAPIVGSETALFGRAALKVMSELYNREELSQIFGRDVDELSLRDLDELLERDFTDSDPPPGGAGAGGADPAPTGQVGTGTAASLSPATDATATTTDTTTTDTTSSTTTTTDAITTTDATTTKAATTPAPPPPAAPPITHPLHHFCKLIIFSSPFSIFGHAAASPSASSVVPAAAVVAPATPTVAVTVAAPATPTVAVTVAATATAGTTPASPAVPPVVGSGSGSDSDSSSSDGGSDPSNEARAVEWNYGQPTARSLGYYASQVDDLAERDAFLDYDFEDVGARGFGAGEGFRDSFERRAYGSEWDQRVFKRALEIMMERLD